MKHMIVGTAGHIDHGKTTLIRALTGRNTDRLEEEQKRGISIELGFTYFDLPSGQRAGIIDVPGHERFIKNMLAGVIGIDIVLLVVAADEGIMPQTLEHLAILDLLGIEKGFVVMTKTDLVEDDWMELVEEEIREEIAGTFLEGRPIIRVSSTEKEGIDKVISLIDEASQELEEKSLEEMPRLAVDRAFTVSGFGTVVTGTLLSGSFKLGDEIQVYPQGKESRIRTLQVHDQEAEVAYAGQRVAMNLAGLKIEDVDRGSTVAPKDSMEPTMMLDVKLKLLKSLDRPIENWTRVRVYLGSKEVLARLVLLDQEILQPGQEALVQLRLEEEVVGKREDKFILRFYSPMFTIGGGQILETHPDKRKRFDEDAIRELEIKAQGDPIQILEENIRVKSGDFPSIKDLQTLTASLEENLKRDIQQLEDQGKVISFSLTKDLYVIHKDFYDSKGQEIADYLASYHQSYPLRKGLSKEELRSRFLSKAIARLGEAILDQYIDQGVIEEDGVFLKTKGFTVVYNEEQEKIKKNILANFASSAYQPERRDEIISKLSADSKEASEVYTALLNDGLILKINEEIHIEKSAYETAKDKLVDYLQKNETISVAQFRDLLDTNRRVALAFLEYFDNVKLTKREDDQRRLV